MYFIINRKKTRLYDIKEQLKKFYGIFYRTCEVFFVYMHRVHVYVCISILVSNL